MTLDMGTLAFAVGISMVIRLAATTVQYVINRAYRGIGLWAIASACAAAGFAILVLRTATAAPPIAIVFQNGFLVLAVLLEYLGTMAFLGRVPRRRLWWGIFAAFLVALMALTFLRDDMVARTVLIHSAIATITFWTAWNLWADRRRSIAQSTRFMSAVFFLSGAFYTLRAIALLSGAGAESMVAPSALQVAELVVAIVEGSLLTFGLIIMVGQRLHSDATEAKRRLELLFNTSPDASIITRLEDGTVVSVNDGFSAITGYPRDEIVGRTTIDALWDDPADRRAMVDRLAEQGSCDNLEAVIRRKDGTRFVGIVSARTFTLDGVAHTIAVVRDITARKLLEDELRVRATTDALTGAFNRGQFMELAHAELRRAQRHEHPLSIALLDIDHFKAINDTHGHLVGDAMLVAFTAALRENIRSIDVLARFGGDEFVLLLPETDAVGARDLAERIRLAVAAMAVEAVGSSVSATACLGIGTMRGGDQSLDSILGRADVALYRAKQHGRNRVEAEPVGD